MFTIYSKDKCQQCDTAKLLCQMKGVDFEIKKLGIDYTKEDVLALVPQARSFPLIFKDGEYLGGLEQLRISLK